MTFYGFLLALLPHEARAYVSPSYSWGAALGTTGRRRFARRIHGSLLSLLVGVLAYPFRQRR